jgi:hypothetical protein
MLFQMPRLKPKYIVKALQILIQFGILWLDCNQNLYRIVKWNKAPPPPAKIRSYISIFTPIIFYEFF